MAPQGRKSHRMSGSLADLTVESMDLHGYNIRGLGPVLRAAEQQRRSQLRRLQHLKLSTEKEAAEQRRLEIKEALEARKQDNLLLERKYKEEGLAIHKAEMEAKRQQTLYNSSMVEEQKRRQAEKKVQKVEQRAEQIKREKDRGARARKELAEDKEMYRQEVLLRNAIITEQRRQAAQMKEELQEAQLQKKAALEAAEAEARVEERLRSEEHRQWVARKAEVEEEQRRLHYAQRQAEKDSVAKRNQAEIEEIVKARQQRLRLQEEERRAKVAYAQHLDAVMAEQNSLKVNSKMARVDAIQAEREQVLATMGRLRQEMSLQEDIYRQTLHNMKVKNKYDSRSLIDFSESMTDVGHFLSFAKSGNWATTSLRRDSRPRTAPNNRKPRARSSSNGRTAAQRENPHSTSLSHSNIIKREPNSNQRRPSSAQPSDPADEASATKPQHRLLQPEPETDSHFSYSYSASKPSREVGSESEASAELVSPRGHESLSQGTQQRRLTARQQELKSRIEREQAKEHSRQAALKVVTDPKERDRLMRIFSLEREEAKRAILALSYA